MERRRHGLPDCVKVRRGHPYQLVPLRVRVRVRLRVRVTVTVTVRVWVGVMGRVGAIS